MKAAHQVRAIGEAVHAVARERRLEPGGVRLRPASQDDAHHALLLRERWPTRPRFGAARGFEAAERAGHLVGSGSVLPGPVSRTQGDFVVLVAAAVTGPGAAALGVLALALLRHRR